MSFKTTRAIVAVMLAAFLAGSTCLAKGDGEEESSKPKVKEKEDEKKEEVRQSNPFTRFWIHTVGAPMARGMKDGMKKVHKGLGIGTDKVKDTFDGDGEKKEIQKNTEKKSGSD